MTENGNAYLEAMEWTGEVAAYDEHEGRLTIPACPACGAPHPEVELVDEDGAPLPPMAHENDCIYYFDLCGRCGGTKGVHVGRCAGLED
jgi:hypothetical protein